MALKKDILVNPLAVLFRMVHQPEIQMSKAGYRFAYNEASNREYMYLPDGREVGAEGRRKIVADVSRQMAMDTLGI